jgi:hypothetical protein
MTDLQLLPLMSMDFESVLTGLGHRIPGQTPGFAIVPSLSQAVHNYNYYDEGILSICPFCFGQYNLVMGGHTCLEQLSLNDPMGPIFNVESSKIDALNTGISQNIHTGYSPVAESTAMATQQEEPVFTATASYGRQDALRSCQQVPEIEAHEKLSTRHYGVQKAPTRAMLESKVAKSDDLHERYVKYTVLALTDPRK